MRILILYISTLVVFLGLDAVWITKVAVPFYRSTLGSIVLERARIAPAVIFYLLNTSGILIFAILPALRSGSWTNAALLGALFGLMTYGCFVFTNHAVIRPWTAGLAWTDLAWGTLLTAIATLVAYLIGRAVLPALGL